MPESARSSDVTAVVYVEGDPALFHQLSAACQVRGVIFQPIADASDLQPTPGVPTFHLAHYPAGVPAPAIQDADVRQRIQFWPSDLVLLDRVPAGELKLLDPELPDEIVLYRIGRGAKQ